VKPIRRHREFEKHFRKRITGNRKLAEQFEARLGLFLVGQRGYPSNDHALSGSLAGRRAFSVTADVRVIYVETTEAIIFLDVGTHAQVYR